ncbi:MAG: flavodoxin family protein [Nitrospinota bacterium]
MNALILNGETSDLKIEQFILDVLADALKDKGALSQVLPLSEMDIGACTGCFGCWIKTPGICVLNDEGRDVTRKIVQNDLLIFLTPVTFGGYSSELKRGLDRIIGFVSPFFEKVSGEWHHKMRYSALPRLVGFGVLSDVDEAAAEVFHALVARNGLNMHQTPRSEVLVMSLGKQKIKERIWNTLNGVGCEN